MPEHGQEDPVMRIFKYELVFPGPIQLPIGAQVLSVGQQDGTPYLWALVDPEQRALATRDLLVVGTGHDALVYGRRFIGTIHGVEGHLVLHVFDQGGSA